MLSESSIYLQRTCNHTEQPSAVPSTFPGVTWRAGTILKQHKQTRRSVRVNIFRYDHYAFNNLFKSFMCNPYKKIYMCNNHTQAYRHYYVTTHVTYM